VRRRRRLGPSALALALGVVRLYAVSGYASKFRLAAVWRGRILLYQAWRNPRPVAHPVGETRYWLTLWLQDGTSLGRPYFVETTELLGGVVMPAGFRAILDRYLSE